MDSTVVAAPALLTTLQWVVANTPASRGPDAIGSGAAANAELFKLSLMGRVRQHYHKTQPRQSETRQPCALTIATVLPFVGSCRAVERSNFRESSIQFRADSRPLK